MSAVRRKIARYLSYLFNRPILRDIIPDSWYLKERYMFYTGKKLHLSNPKTFNEKLQWLKLYDRNPLYIQLVDKHEVREYVSKKIGEQHLIRELGVWDTFDEINFDQLPEQFVLKCTHDSSSTIICTDKSKFNFSCAKKSIDKAMKTNFFYFGREWPYKYVKPKVIAEEYITNEYNSSELSDYKFFCFNGSVKLLFVGTERQSGCEVKFDFYDLDFNHINLRHGHPNSSKIIDKPKNFSTMLKLAEQLSTGIPHVRVDFYESNGILYFGEMTFFHHSGFVNFDPEEWDRKLGDWLVLPKKI